jgi:hypothetical protein
VVLFGVVIHSFGPFGVVRFGAAARPGQEWEASP